MTSVCADLMQRDRVLDRGMEGILYVHVLLLFHICSFYIHFQEVTSPAKLTHFKFNMTAVDAT